MSEMIDRVAQALKDAGLREDYDVRLALARAAIEAMREPTPDMVHAGQERDDPYGEVAFCEEHWDAMVAEALK